MVMITPAATSGTARSLAVLAQKPSGSSATSTRGTTMSQKARSASRCSDVSSLMARSIPHLSVTLERHGAAAVLTIDRPQRRNAIDGPTAAALLDGYERFTRDD